MPKILVDYLTIFREIIGKRNEEVVLSEGASVEDLLQHLISCYGSKFKEIMIDFKTGDLSGYIMIIVNDKVLKVPIDLKYKLKDYDRVTIGIPAFGG